jgi:hypothetical protein
VESYNLENAKDLYEALLTLYVCQTRNEQESELTTELNGVGFNAVDSTILSSYSKWLQEVGFLTEKQQKVCRDLLPKYKKQLGALQRSILPSKVMARINNPVTPAPKTNGTLSLSNGHLEFSPTVYPSVQIKQVANFVWKGKEVGWSGPLAMPIVEGVERLFSPISLSDELKRWIEEQNRPQELSAVIENSSLFPGQKKGTAFALKSKRCLIGMKPGLGKTASVIFAGNELNPYKYDAILVVCPLTLVNNWKKELKKWIDADATIWHGPMSTWTSYDRWVITNYETVARNLEDMKRQEFKVVILDETILVKNRKAKRTDAVKELCKKIEYVWLLSGSPSSKFLDDMWSQLNIIDSKRFSSYWRFVDQYCEKEVNEWGVAVVNNRDGAIDQIQTDLSDIYYTANVSEFPVIPEWIFDDIETPMKKVQYRLYREMEREFLATLPEGDEILAPNVLSQMIRLSQFASNPLLLDGPDESGKWDAVLDIMEYSEGPFIVWTNFIRTAELMCQRLKAKGLRVESLTGETLAMKRQIVVDEMQSGNLDVIVAHPAVGKFGLTLTKARTAIYLERSFNGDDYYQSLYRFRRIGTVFPPHVIHLISSRPDGDEWTIDHTIGAVLKFRRDNSIAITSGMIRGMLGKNPKETK